MVTVTYCNYTITYCNTLLHGTGSEIVLQANMNNPIAESVPSCKLIRHWQRMLREHLGGQSIFDGQISLMSVSTCVERPCILPFFANYLSMPICLRLFSFWVTTTYDRSSRLLPKCETQPSDGERDGILIRNAAGAMSTDSHGHGYGISMDIPC